MFIVGMDAKSYTVYVVLPFALIVANSMLNVLADFENDQYILSI
jgi:hypothetical protein